MHAYYTIGQNIYMSHFSLLLVVNVKFSGPRVNYKINITYYYGYL